MKNVLRAAVRAYWAVWPRHLNRGCIYRETCSHHVYRVTDEGGFAAGLRALLSRVRTCRPGYTVSTDETGLGLILLDGSFLPDHLVADDVLAPIQLTITQLEQHLSNDDRTPNKGNGNYGNLQDLQRTRLGEVPEVQGYSACWRRTFHFFEPVQ